VFRTHIKFIGFQIKSNRVTSTIDPLVIAKNLDLKISVIFGKKKKEEIKKRENIPSHPYLPPPFSPDFYSRALIFSPVRAFSLRPGPAAPLFPSLPAVELPRLVAPHARSSLCAPSSSPMAAPSARPNHSRAPPSASSFCA
jgi:hypothetical protein